MGGWLRIAKSCITFGSSPLLNLWSKSRQSQGDVCCANDFCITHILFNIPLITFQPSPKAILLCDRICICYILSEPTQTSFRSSHFSPIHGLFLCNGSCITHSPDIPSDSRQCIPLNLPKAIPGPRCAAALAYVTFCLSLHKQPSILHIPALFLDSFVQRVLHKSHSV